MTAISRLTQPPVRAAAGVAARLLMSPAGRVLPTTLILVRYISRAGAVVTVPVRAIRDGDILVAAAGHFVHVMVDRAMRRPATINDAHRAVLQRVC